MGCVIDLGYLTKTIYKLIYLLVDYLLLAKKISVKFFHQYQYIFCLYYFLTLSMIYFLIGSLYWLIYTLLKIQLACFTERCL